MTGTCMTCSYFLTLGHLWGAMGTAGGALNNSHALLCSLHETSMKSAYTREIHDFAKRRKTMDSSSAACTRRKLLGFSSFLKAFL